MDVEDWTDLDEKHLETWQQRVELVETLLDESTIRNYLKRYREHGSEGLMLHRRHGQPRSPRIHDAALRHRILALVEEHPWRTVPQLRRMLTRDSEYPQHTLRGTVTFIDEIERPIVPADNWNAAGMRRSPVDQQ